MVVIYRRETRVRAWLDVDACPGAPRWPAAARRDRAAAARAAEREGIRRRDCRNAGIPANPERRAGIRNPKSDTKQRTKQTVIVSVVEVRAHPPAGLGVGTIDVTSKWWSGFSRCRARRSPPQTRSPSTSRTRSCTGTRSTRPMPSQNNRTTRARSDRPRARSGCLMALTSADGPFQRGGACGFFRCRAHATFTLRSGSA